MADSRRVRVEADKNLFSGVVPLFPLAHPTLFPGLVQPFQIFEPRYRAMTAAVLKGERLIAMTVLKPQWETKYESKTAPVQPIVCVGRVTIDEQLPDGRYLLMLRGLFRARIISELEGDEPYRLAELRELPDVLPASPVIEREERRAELLRLFQELFPQTASQAALLPLMNSEVSFSAICDLLAFSVHLPASELYGVLAETNVDLRSDRILDALKQRLHAERHVAGPAFPPAFSAN